MNAKWPGNVHGQNTPVHTRDTHPQFWSDFFLRLAIFEFKSEKRYQMTPNYLPNSPYAFHIHVRDQISVSLTPRGVVKFEEITNLLL